MENILKEMYLDEMDVTDIKINCEEFKIFDCSNESPSSLIYYSKYKYDTIKNYMIKHLDKGHGVYCNGKIYYKNILIPIDMNPNRKALVKYINEVKNRRKQYNKAILDRLHNPQDYVLILNYVKMYNLGLQGLDWVESKLEGKVDDVKEFIDLLFENKEMKKVA